MIRDDKYDIEDFRDKFNETYWSDGVQNAVRSKIQTGNLQGKGA